MEMGLSFNGRMEAYYQKFIELQEKLRKSEEERLKLEVKFNEMLQITREEEQAHYKKLRSQYKRFLDEDKKRQERNERIVRTLERIEARVNMLTSRTDRFKMLKRQYQSYVQRISRVRSTDKTEHPPEKIEEDTAREQQTRNISEHRKDMPDHLSLKKAMGKSNEEKIEILDKYLQSLATQKCKDTIDNEEKDPQSDLSQLKYLDNISRKMDEGFNSNQANSIAEDIMNSIYSRHYKKDLFQDEINKANKFTTPNYLNNDIPLKQTTSGFGDFYTTSSALENVDNNAAIGKDFSFDEFHKNRPISSYEDNFEYDGLNKKNYTVRENIPKSFSIYDKQADNKEIDGGRARKRMLEDTANMLSKNKDYSIEINPLNKSTDYKKKNFAGDDSEYPKFNQNQSQVDPLSKSMDKASNPDPLLKDKDYLTKDFTNNDYPKTNQIPGKGMEYNKTGLLLKEKVHQSKDFTTNDSEYLKSGKHVKFEKLQDDMAYAPSKTEIDIIENEKQIVNNYPVPRGDNNVDTLSNDISDRVVEQQNQVGVIEREIEHSKHSQNLEHYDTELADNEINHRDTHLAEQLDNKNHEGLYNIKSIKQVNDSDSVIINERQEIVTTIPDQQFDENESNYDNEKNYMNQVAANVQDIQEYKKNIDIQNNDEIQDEYIQQQVTNEDQYVEDKASIQYNQYEEPTQYDQFGNQILYDENGQVVELQYDENEQPHNQSEPYDAAAQQHYDESRPDVQYDENGQPIHSYDQQYDENGQPILYDQQYDASGQPVQQLYDENGQVFQQYDQSEQLHSYNQNSHPIQYDENGELAPQYDENGQLMQQYDESGQPIEYAENTQPIQEYGENEQPTEQYNQGDQLVQEYEQPFQQYENEQSVEQYNQGDQLVQGYEQSFQQYDADGQPIVQYDENGQPIYQYDENVQPLQQYDENGQVIQHYDENSLQQYNENDQPPEEYDEKSQPIIQQGENVQLSQDVPILRTSDNEVDKLPANTNDNQRIDPHDESLEEDKSKIDSSKSTVKEDINSPMVEENNESQQVKQKNVLDMLDTDTESLKHSTSKISNDSDFDFSNG